MTKPKLLTESEATGLLDRLAPDWPLLLCDGVVIDHVLKVIASADRTEGRDGTVPARRPRSRRRARVRQKTILTRPRVLPCVCSPRIRIRSN